MTQAKNPGPISESKMSDRPRCGGFLFYNADRWRQEKEKGTPEQSFRVFTNESGVLWRKLSNLGQSVWDARAAHTPYCIEKARKKGLTPEQLEMEQQDELLQKCDALRAKSDKMAKKAERLERKAENPVPLSPFMEFSSKHKGAYRGNPIQRAKALGAAWRQLSPEEKQGYETEAWRNYKSKSKSLGARLKKKQKVAADEDSD
jgi:hypothetical protein